MNLKARLLSLILSVLSFELYVPSTGFGSYVGSLELWAGFPAEDARNVEGAEALLTRGVPANDDEPLTPGEQNYQQLPSMRSSSLLCDAKHHSTNISSFFIFLSFFHVALQ